MITWRGAFGRTDQSLFFDPQTNGGLLFALPTADASALVAALDAAAVNAAVVGEVVERSGEDFLEIG